MTPKSLLRHKLCVSSLADMAEGSTFLSVIPETSKTMADDKKIRRVVLCSGKLYYELLAARGLIMRCYGATPIPPAGEPDREDERERPRGPQRAPPPGTHRAHLVVR